MRHRHEETLYGPEIRFTDWKLEAGAAERGGGCLISTDEARTVVVRDDYPYGGGGDVALTLELDFDSFTDGARFEAHFNFQPRDPQGRGFRVEMDRAEGRVHLAGSEIGRFAHAGTAPGVRHLLRLVTLGESYALSYGDTLIAGGSMDPPFVDNEGIVRLEARGCRFRLISFREDAVGYPVRPRRWKRKELLYRESFDPSGFDERWVCNSASEAARPELLDRSIVFRHLSNNLLRRSFASPLVVDFTVRPVPSDRFSSGVTDAIFIWMASHPDEPLPGFLDRQTREGRAGLPMLLPLPFYWVDFGGTNNVTTRLRKNPHRHMMRQYTDAARLLSRGRSYDVSVVQFHDWLELQVDGEPMIAMYDRTPLTEGHVGVRAFVADLEVSKLEIWRIGEPG